MKRKFLFLVLIIALTCMFVACGILPVTASASPKVGMSDTDPWTQLLFSFLTQLLPVLIAFAGGLFALWKLWLDKHIKNNEFKSALLYATNLIEVEVGKAESYAVKQAKIANGNGKLTTEQGAQIKQDVLNAISKQLPADVCAALGYVIPDVTGWVDSQLQKAVQGWSNQAQGAAPVTGGVST